MYTPPNALTLNHSLLQEVLKSGDSVIDATLGNGYDALFMKKLIGPTGNLYGFDIQEQAIKNSIARLKDNNFYQNINFHLIGHEYMVNYLKENELIKAVTFNLGYLPSADKTIITQAKTTIQAINSILPHLAKGGLINLVIYTGHPGGQEEGLAINHYCQHLDQKDYTVYKYGSLNQINNPPYLISIYKR